MAASFRVCCSAGSILLAAVLMMPDGVAQRVFSNSRPQASARTQSNGSLFGSRTGTSTGPRTSITTGPRNGIGFRGPAINSQQPVFNNSRPQGYVGGGVTFQRNRRTSRVVSPGFGTFSGPAYFNPGVAGFNGVIVNPVVGPGGQFFHGHVNPGWVPSYGGAAWTWDYANYPWGPAYQMPFGVYAPPVIVPTFPGGGLFSVTAQTFGTGAIVGPSATAIQPAGPSSVVGSFGSVPNGNVDQPAVTEGNSTRQLLDSLNAMSRTPVDETSFVNEFSVAGPPTDVESSSAASRIRSLRYQSSADQEFRDGKLADAIALYKAAQQQAPDRQAPWLRCAFARVLLQDFDNAARDLKAALNRNDEPTAAWIGEERLKSQSLNEKFLQAQGAIWEWLHARPNSSDRLLLTAAWCEFRGHSGTARELLSMASAAGLPRNMSDNLLAVIQDRQPKPGEPVKSGSVTTSENDDEGIVIRRPEKGSDTAAASDVPSGDVPPGDAASDASANGPDASNDMLKQSPGNGSPNEAFRGEAGDLKIPL